MSTLLLKPNAPADDGCIQRITPVSANWHYVGFEVFELAAGTQFEQATGEQEVCLVLLSGLASVETKHESFAGIGRRMTPFADEAPFAVYAPPRDRLSVSAATDVELALCKAPAKGRYPARLIRPEDCPQVIRGEGTNTRYVRNILFDDIAAERLLVVEVITPGGHWSSYPPHKHDSDDAPEETQLEETYYHRLNPPQGFAFQRVYTDDRSLDESLCVSDKSVVLVPQGYHPVGTPHGYDLYYLNTMAGPRREWIFRNDPDHEWIVRNN